MGFWDSFGAAQEMLQRRDAYQHGIAQQELENTKARFNIEDILKQRQEETNPASFFNRDREAKLRTQETQAKENEARADYYLKAPQREADQFKKSQDAIASREKIADANDKRNTEKDLQASFEKYLTAGYSPKAASTFSHKPISAEEMKILTDDAIQAGTLSATKATDPAIMDRVKQFVSAPFGGAGSKWGGGIAQGAGQAVPGQVGKTEQEMQNEALSLPSPKFAAEQAKAAALQRYRAEQSQAANLKAQAYVEDMVNREEYRQLNEEFRQKNLAYQETYKNAELRLRRTMNELHIQEFDLKKLNGERLEKYRTASMGLRKQTDAQFNHLQNLDAQYVATETKLQGMITGANTIITNQQENGSPKQIAAIEHKAAAENQLELIGKDPNRVAVKTQLNALLRQRGLLIDENNTGKNGKSLTPPSIGGRNTTLDDATAQQIFKEAGRDPKRAAELARKRGFLVP